jgi:hypothetical protein
MSYTSAPVTEFSAEALDTSLYVGVGGDGAVYPTMDVNNLFVAPAFTGKDPTSTATPASFSVIIGPADATVDGAGGLLATGVVALAGGAILPKYVNATGTMADLGYSQGVSDQDTATNIFKGLPLNAVVPKAYVDATINMLLNLNDGQLDTLADIAAAIGNYDGNLVTTLGSITTRITTAEGKITTLGTNLGNLAFENFLSNDYTGNTLPTKTSSGHTAGTPATVTDAINSLQQQLTSALLGIQVITEGTNGALTASNATSGIYGYLNNINKTLHGSSDYSTSPLKGSLMADLLGYVGVDAAGAPVNIPGLMAVVANSNQTSYFDTLQMNVFGEKGALLSTGKANYTYKGVENEIPAGGLIGMILDNKAAAAQAQADATEALATLGVASGTTVTAPVFTKGVTAAGTVSVIPVLNGDASLYISANWRIYVPPLNLDLDPKTEYSGTTAKLGTVYNMLQMQFNPNPAGYDAAGIPLSDNKWVNAFQCRAPQVVGTVASTTAIIAGGATGGTGGTTAPIVTATGPVTTTASAVYGQAAGATAMTLTGAGAGTRGMNLPTNTCVDKNGNLYVSDTLNNRVLYFAAGSTTATGVYGQPDFTSTASGLTATTLNGPAGIAVDSAGGLYVADNYNNRVVYFPSGTMSSGNGTAAAASTYCYGQPDSSTYMGIGNGPTDLSGPSSVVIDKTGKVYICDSINSRVLVFNPIVVATTTSVPSPIGVYGQSNYTANTASLFNSLRTLHLDKDDNLYVGCYKQVLYFDKYTYGNGAGVDASNLTVAAPIGIFGKGWQLPYPASVGASSIDNVGGIVTDGIGGLYVSDFSFNRILYFPTSSMATIEKTAMAVATVVYGQSDFTTTTANKGTTPDGSTFDGCGGLSFYSAKLYVADRSNNRVLVFAP